LQSIITAVGTGIPIPVVIAPPSVFPWHN
jgi:hypothetical protein